MHATLKLRLIGFTMAILVMVFLIREATDLTWSRIEELRDRVTTVNLESYRIADEFQAKLLAINNGLLHYEILQQPSEWGDFQRLSDDLNRWIAEQKPLLRTPMEKAVMQQIDEGYDKFLAAAELSNPARNPAGAPASLQARFELMDREIKKLQELGYRLSEAHRSARDELVARYDRSLRKLVLLVNGSLALLVCGLIALAFLLYRSWIAPLKTKLAESEVLVERQEKLASLGELAAGIAHEIRNPLTAIKARLFTLEKGLTPGSLEHKDATVMSKEIARLEHVVKDFLHFAHPADPELVELDADAPLRDVSDLLGPELREAGIVLRLEPDPAARLRADPAQLKQVLINLVQNAADALDRNGIITLRARRCSATLRGRSQAAVVLEVEDNGPGISPEVEKRLFDPFFTTKDSGTGLGLSIAARIMEKHGGSLQYRTQLKHGTVFGIVFSALAPHETDPPHPRN